MEMTDQIVPTIQVTIQVKPEQPEQNREVLIYMCERMPSIVEPDTYHRGYVILIEADQRFVEDRNMDPEIVAQFYTGKFVSAEVVKFIVPALPYCLFCDTQAVQAAVQAAGLTNAVEEGIVNATSIFVAEPTRWLKRLRLVFPDGHRLSSKTVVDGDATGNGLDREWIQVDPVKTEGKLGSTKHFAAFRIARLDQMPYKPNMTMDG